MATSLQHPFFHLNGQEVNLAISKKRISHWREHQVHALILRNIIEDRAIVYRSLLKAPLGAFIVYDKAIATLSKGAKITLYSFPDFVKKWSVKTVALHSACHHIDISNEETVCLYSEDFLNNKIIRLFARGIQTGYWINRALERKFLQITHNRLLAIVATSPPSFYECNLAAEPIRVFDLPSFDLKTAIKSKSDRYYLVTGFNSLQQQRIFIIYDIFTHQLKLHTSNQTGDLTHLFLYEDNLIYTLRGLNESHITCTDFYYLHIQTGEFNLLYRTPKQELIWQLIANKTELIYVFHLDGGNYLKIFNIQEKIFKFAMHLRHIQPQSIKLSLTGHLLTLCFKSGEPNYIYRIVIDTHLMHIIRRVKYVNQQKSSYYGFHKNRFIILNQHHSYVEDFSEESLQPKTDLSRLTQEDRVSQIPLPATHSI